jgi:hypothetical protein
MTRFGFCLLWCLPVASTGVLIGHPHTVLPTWDRTVWNNPPPNGPQVMLSYGTMLHASFYSQIMETDIGYNIYRPPQYATQPTATFPVVYWLNGRGSSENGGCLDIGMGCDDATRAMFTALDNAIHAATVTPMIVVLPNGGLNSKYMDASPASSNYGSYMVESMLIYELLPYIEATYRVTTNKRAIQGGSMGGMGCERLLFKFPGLWKSAYCFFPAIDDVGTPPPGPPCCPTSNIANNEPVFFPNMFASDDITFEAQTVWGLLVSNHAAIKAAAVPMHVTIGDEDALYTGGYQTQLFTTMDGYGVSHDPLSVVGGCGHDSNCVGTGVGWANWSFAASHF